MKKLFKKFFALVFTFILMFFGFSLCKNVNAASNCHIYISNIISNSLDQDTNLYTFRLKTSVQGGLMYLAINDVTEICLCFYSTDNYPSSISSGETNLTNESIQPMFTLSLPFSQYIVNQTDNYVFDFNNLLKYDSQSYYFTIAFKRVNGTIYSSSQLFTISTRTLEVAPGMQYKVVVSNNINIYRFIPSTLKQHVSGLYNTSDEIIADDDGNIVSNTATFIAASYLKVKYEVPLIFMLDGDKNFLDYEVGISGGLPVLSDSIKAKLDKSSEGLYVSSLFNLVTDEVYYNGKFEPFNYSDSIICLYPRYRTSQFKLYYNNDYATNQIETYAVRLYCDEQITLDAHPFAREGYEFVGWSRTKDSKVAEYEDQETLTFEASEGDVINLYPVWRALTYKLTINMNDGLHTYEYDYKTDEAISLNIDTTRTGYTFADWSQEIPATMPGHDVTISALWVVNQYKVDFYVEEDGELAKTEFVDYNSAVNDDICPVLKKENYDFVEWNSNLPSVMPANDIAIYGIWTLKEFTLTFESVGSKTLITQKFGTTITPPTLEPRIGYRFTGWDQDVPETMPNKSMTIIAMWERVDFTVTCKLENGESDDIYVFGLGEQITGIKEPEKSHYEFNGWDKDIPEYAEEDLVLTAQWVEVKYNIKINDADDVDYIEYTFRYGERIEIPNPTKYNYDFVSYSSTLPDTMPNHDIEVTALWVTHKYKIYFDTDGGNYMAPLEVAYKVKVVITETPVKEGYKFISWDEAVPQFLTKDITLKALWKEAAYTIKYYVNDTLYKEDNYDYLETIVLPDNPSVDGLRFVSWDQDVPNKMPSENLEFHAVFDIVGYKVKFLDDNLEVLAEDSYEYGEKIEKIDDPVKQNYHFIGWYTSKEYSEKFNFDEILVNDDINIYAYFQEFSKQQSISISDYSFNVNLDAYAGFYENINLSLRVVTNDNLDEYKANELYYDYSRIGFGEKYKNYAIGGIYSIDVLKNNVFVKYFDIDVNLEIDIPENITDKKLALFMATKEGIKEITDWKLENNKIKFSTNMLSEFVVGYEIPAETPEKNGCGSKAIVELLSMIVLCSAALFALRKKHGM